MRRFRLALMLSLLTCAPVLASELQINQSASANYFFAAVSPPETSTIEVHQTGRDNVVSAAQLAPDLNQIATKQSGWTNTVTIYQQGHFDIATVTQSGLHRSAAPSDTPTRYSVQEIDQGYLSTFTSGELSIITLTSPDRTYVSHFGRRH